MRQRTVILFLAFLLPLLMGHSKWPDPTPAGGRSYPWRADSMSVGGSGADDQCEAPTEVQINSGPELYTIICDDSDDALFEGHTRMPQGWTGTPLTFDLSVTQTADEQATFTVHVSAQCCDSQAGEISSTFGNEVQMQIGATTGNSYIDTVTSGAVTPSGTCTGGAYLFWQMEVDATATTATVASLHILGVEVKFDWDGSDQIAAVTRLGTDWSQDPRSLGAWLIGDTEETTELNRAPGAAATTDMEWQGGAWTSGAAPVGTPTGYDAVEFFSAWNQVYNIDDSTGNADIFEVADFTIACWVTWDVVGRLLSKNDVTSFEWYNSADSEWAARLVGTTEVTVVGSFPTGEWAHLAFTRDDDTGIGSLYLNGNVACTGSCPAMSAPTPNTDDYVLGANQSGGGTFEGDMMECLHFAPGLAATEVAELALCGYYGTSDGEWRSGTYDGATCSDISNACCPRV